MNKARSMPTHDPSSHDLSPPPAAAPQTRQRSRWVFGGFVAAVALLLAVEHRAHLLGWLPWLILLACPLMHLFMHGGHGGQGNSSSAGEQ